MQQYNTSFGIMILKFWFQIRKKNWNQNCSGFDYDFRVSYDQIVGIISKSGQTLAQ